MIGLDNYHGPQKCLHPADERRLVRTYLDARAKALANPRQPSRPRLEDRLPMREIAARFGVTPRTAWRYVAAARKAA